MTGWRIPVLLALSLLVSACASAPDEILENAYPSVMIVQVFDKQHRAIALGSAVVIAEDAVITNCHVVEDGGFYQLRQRRKYYQATLQYADPGRDLCQLKSPGLGLTPVAMVAMKDLKVGQPVYSVTAPAGFARNVSAGTILALTSHDGMSYIRTDAEVAPGSSGGGLFDAEGRLVGITTFLMYSGDRKYTYAVPAELINELSERAQPEFEGGILKMLKEQR